MPLKLTPISLLERDELEPLLLADPEAIEKGLQVIANQYPTDSGPLDILAVDEDGTLVVIELKNEAADGHLVQALRYYDWCSQNLAWIARAHKKPSINPEAQPRIILIAPSYTDTVKRVAKYINISLQLFEYHAFENEKKEKGIICTEIGFDQPIEPPSIPTMERKFDYIQDTKVKELLKAVLSELQETDVDVKPLQDRWISCRYNGKRFMTLGANKDFFTANILLPGGNWTGRQRVTKRDEWNDIFGTHIKPTMEYLGNANK